MQQPFNPARGAHSLIETVFFVSFTPSFEAASLRALGEPLPDLMEMFSHHNQSREIQFRIEQGGASVGSEAVAGAEYTKRDKDGQNEWILRITRDFISVHCLNYTRWDDVWAFAKGALMKTLDRIPDGTVISSIGFKNIDQFEYVGEEDKYDLRSLFQYPNPYVAGVTLEHGPRWHCHTGWFESLDDFAAVGLPGEVLNQLNIDSSHKANPSGSKLISVIDHNLAIFGNVQHPITVSPSSSDVFEALMRKLHAINKHVLGSLLIEDMRRRINLSLGEAS